MINPRISADWSTPNPIAQFSCTQRVQVHTKAERKKERKKENLPPYPWCTREYCNRLGRTPICRDSRVNHMFHNTFPTLDN